MIFEDLEFRNLKEKHAKEILSFLLQKQEEFDILCAYRDIDFNPSLPKHISSQFKDVIIFSLANYTLSTAHFEGEKLVFEAGFGEENFGSVVSVPIETILQISQNDTPLFINVSASIPKPKEEKPKNPFALNPRNKKLLD
ncbi:hypothetical protein [Caminibacter pacificus]|uniref:Stringent starvation protein B n=1 Tax=Caminibacter pacificus TaxID=1424653 RepID=A0AAJ4UXX9_9BACT|nr:hypothetical protein [Caminibacter pacificus]QCI27827.1 hypothetical protein C6V80_02260 [Caminibacter pacificus]ROR39996.1 hypothetical protein EDC58_0976 [Caminibacter pacificus]